MHAENPENFQIPHPVLKKHAGVGHFVELRIDSPRFSVHEDAAEKCYCPTCLGEATKFSAHLLEADKVYRTRIQFGAVTDTGDAEGEVVRKWKMKRSNTTPLRLPVVSRPTAAGGPTSSGSSASLRELIHR